MLICTVVIMTVIFVCAVQLYNVLNELKWEIENLSDRLVDVRYDLKMSEAREQKWGEMPDEREVHVPTPDEGETLEEHTEPLTQYERELLEREYSFDARIARMKDELGYEQKDKRVGTLAPELHPAVHNLPHDLVKDTYDHLPDVEIAE